MKSLTQYINEAQKQFVDPDTGELVTVSLPDVDADKEADVAKKLADGETKWDRCIKLEKEIRAKLEPLEDEQWGYQEELKDAQREYRSLHSDMEEELGPLYAEGTRESEAEAEKRAQYYGERFNELEDQIDELKKKIDALQPKIEELREKKWAVWTD